MSIQLWVEGEFVEGGFTSPVEAEKHAVEIARERKAPVQLIESDDSLMSEISVCAFCGSTERYLGSASALGRDETGCNCSEAKEARRADALSTTRES